MKTVKEEVIDAISALPEDASIEDIKYTLHVIYKIKIGQKDIENGRYISSKELRNEVSKW